MKKNILLFLLIIINISFAFCDDWLLGEHEDSVSIEYKVTKDSDLYNSSGKVIGKVKKDTIFQTNILAIIYNISNNKDLYAFPYNEGYILSENLIIKNFTHLNDLYQLQKNYFTWISTECNNVISAKNPEEYLSKISDYAKVCNRFDESIGWYQPTITIQNTVLLIHFTTTDIPFKILNITRKENPKTPFCFTLECMPKTEYTSDELARENLLNFPIFSENQIIKLDIEISNNHLFLYNGENGKLIQEYMQVKNEWIDLFSEYLCDVNREKRSKLKQKEDYIIDFSNLFKNDK